MVWSLSSENNPSLRDCAVSSEIELRAEQRTIGRLWRREKARQDEEEEEEEKEKKEEQEKTKKPSSIMEEEGFFVENVEKEDEIFLLLRTMIRLRRGIVDDRTKDRV